MPHTVIHLVTLSELNSLVDAVDKMPGGLLRLNVEQLESGSGASRVV